MVNSLLVELCNVNGTVVSTPLLLVVTKVRSPAVDCNVIGTVVSRPVTLVHSTSGKKVIPVDPDKAGYVTDGFVSLLRSETKGPLDVLRSGLAGSLISIAGCCEILVKTHIQYPYDV